MIRTLTIFLLAFVLSSCGSISDLIEIAGVSPNHHRASQDVPLDMTPSNLTNENTSVSRNVEIIESDSDDMQVIGVTNNYHQLIDIDDLYNKFLEKISSDLFKQSPYFNPSVSGQVKAERSLNNSYVDVYIKKQVSGSEYQYVTTTDKDGYYQFDIVASSNAKSSANQVVLTPGYCSVQFQRSGYIAEKIENVLILNGNGNLLIDAELKIDYDAEIDSVLTKIILGDFDLTYMSFDEFRVSYFDAGTESWINAGFADEEGFVTFNISDVSVAKKYRIELSDGTTYTSSTSLLYLDNAVVLPMQPATTYLYCRFKNDDDYKSVYLKQLDSDQITIPLNYSSQDGWSIGVVDDNRFESNSKLIKSVSSGSYVLHMVNFEDEVATRNIDLDITKYHTISFRSLDLNDPSTEFLNYNERTNSRWQPSL